MDEVMMNRGSRWGRLKVFAALMMLAFAVTLALVIASRLSDEALAVLAGSVCGVGAAIPTSLLIVAVTHRRDGERVRPAPQQGSYPPVVVVAPPGGQQRSSNWTFPPSLAAPVQRQFTVVGGTPVDSEVISYERYS
jgi:hypothetical protein